MTASQALAWALSQVGITEHPAGSNRVPYWDDVLPELQGSPWCGAFVWDALKRADADLSWSTARRFVYCPAGLADARSAGLVHAGQPRPGDIVWFNFDSVPGPEHVGLVVDAAGWPARLTTVEGNTSLAGSQSNGGQVLRRVRAASMVAGFATPTYPAAPAAPAPLEDDVFVHATSSSTDGTTVVAGMVFQVGPGTRGWINDPAVLEPLAAAGMRWADLTGDQILGQWPTLATAPTPIDVEQLAAHLAEHLPQAATIDVTQLAAALAPQIHAEASVDDVRAILGGLRFTL